MNLRNARSGYVFLISVLVVGVVASAIVSTLVLWGIASQQTILAYQQTAQAFAAANVCVERGLLKLRNDPSYAGGETVNLSQGKCDILIVGGAGNENRTLCAEGESGLAVRRIQIVIQAIQPTTKIYSWQEVDVFTSCTYE